MDSKNTKSGLLSLIFSMFIFGTIGIFVRFIPFSSGFIATFRGYTGFLFIALFMLITKQKPDFSAIKKNFIILLVSGAFIGFNWILLFEAYNYTTIANATLCYYFQPVFVLLLSPFLLKEKFTLKKLLCVILSLCGMVFISMPIDKSFFSSTQAKGIFLGLCAALLYALELILNKKLKNIGPFETTALQLVFAAISVTPYTLLNKGNSDIKITLTSIVLLLCLGIIHTGFAYTLYFGSIKKVAASTASIFGYIDPCIAIILSSLIFKEPFTLYSLSGTVLILGSALYCSIEKKE